MTGLDHFITYGMRGCRNWQCIVCHNMLCSMLRHAGIKGDNVVAQQIISTSLHCGGKNMILKAKFEEVVFQKIVEDSKTFISYKDWSKNKVVYPVKSLFKVSGRNLSCTRRLMLHSEK